MFEAQHQRMEKEPGDSLHTRLLQLRRLAESTDSVTENCVASGIVELSPESEINIRVSAVNFDVPGRPIYVKLGEDFTNPELHDWIMTDETGAVYRHNFKRRGFDAVDSTLDIQVFQEVVSRFTEQYQKQSA